MSRMITVAVIVLVTDAIWNSVSPSTLSGCSTLVTPNAAMSMSPARSMPMATPGTWYRSMAPWTRVSSAGSTSRDARTCARASRTRPSLGRRTHDAEAALTHRDLAHPERESTRKLVEALLERATDPIEQARGQRTGGEAAHAHDEPAIHSAHADVACGVDGEHRRAHAAGEVHARGVDRRAETRDVHWHSARDARLGRRGQVRIGHDERNLLILVGLGEGAEQRVPVLYRAAGEDASDRLRAADARHRFGCFKVRNALW